MQRLKHPQKFYSSPLVSLLFLAAIVLALSSCTNNHPNGACSAAIPPQPSLYIVNGDAYAGEGNSIYALQASNGTQLWHSTINAATSLSTVSNGIIYVGSPSSLYALQTSNGKQIWHVQQSGEQNSLFGLQPFLVNGIIYTASNTSTYALQVSDGKQLWHSQIGAIETPLASPLTVANGMVYIGTLNGVAALQASDGTQLWSFQPAKNIIGATDGIVYVSSENGLYALRAKDGTQLWNFQGTGASTSTFGPHALLNNGVIYIDSGYTVYALKAKDGTQLWKSQVSVNDATPIQADQNTVYVSANGVLIALQASNGSLLQNSNLGINSRTVINGIAYSASSAGGCNGPVTSDVHAVHMSDGKSVWEFQF